MARTVRVVAPAFALLFCLGGCASKYHPPEVDTSQIETLAAIVTQDAGQPISLTLVESEVTRHLYQRFRLVTAAQLAAALGRPQLPGRLLLDPATCAEIERQTGVDAILEVTVTGHEIEWTTARRHRAYVGIAMQLIEIPTGTVRWSRLCGREKTSDTISPAVHDAVGDAVWDCLKHLIGWESIVRQDDLVRVCSSSGLHLDAAPDVNADGLVVRHITPGTVWERSGLRAGDVIARVNGRPLDGTHIEWPNDTRKSEVSLAVNRGDALVEVTVPLDEAEISPARPHPDG
jgi:ABC-type uncharacterized transport system auxiliary subunit